MPDAAAGPRPPGVLFVCYDGILGGPGRSQVLPYLRGYSGAGWRVRLLSFEKPTLLADAPRRAAVEEEARAAGAAWTVLPYRGSAIRDLASGLAAVARAAASERPRVLHARSYVPALLALVAARPFGAVLLFDMRGFWPDERRDAGAWGRGHPSYVLWKWIERLLLRAAGGVVTLSAAGMEILLAEGLLPPGTPREVIPCGADLDRFSARSGGDPPAALRPFLGRRTYCFLGSTGPWYLVDEMLDFAASAVRAEPDARALFLAEDGGGAIAAGLASRGVPPDRSLVAPVPHAEVPRWIAASRAGVFFIRSCRSKRASCPTKLAEFLACGVPVVINPGVGDTEEIVRGASVGVVAGRFDEPAFAAARADLDRLRADPGLGARCRAEAERRFDARRGAEAFERLARRIGAR